MSPRTIGIPLLLFSAALATTLAALAQQAPAPAPLQKMPFSPVLNLTSLDRSVNPCNDFYKFSCGGWIKNNPIPSDQAGWSVYGKLTNENQQFLWGILDTDARLKTRTPVQQKVGDAFAACMDTATIDKRGLDPLRPQLVYVDSLNDRAAIHLAVARLDLEAQGSFFFNAGADQDASDSNSVIANVGAGGLGLPDRDYYTKTDAHSIEVRAKYVAYIAQLFVLAGEPEAKASADAADVLRIETVLAKASLTRVERRDPYKSFHKMSVAGLAALNPAIDWKPFFASRGLTGLSTVNVAQPAFQQAVDAELKTESIDSLKSYLRFHLLTAAAPSLSSPFETAAFDFSSRYLRGVQQPPPRWKRCVRIVDRTLGEALGQEFVARTFAAETKAKTLVMTKQIEAVMGDEIEHLDWMSPATKKEALRKLHAVRNKIGYPDTWRDYSALTIQPGDFFGNTLRQPLRSETRLA